MQRETSTARCFESLSASEDLTAALSRLIQNDYLT